MSHQLLGAFIVFAVVALFTPGPNNVMLMSSGLNFGLRRAQPHIWGVTLGFSFMVLVVGFGLGAVFATYPALYAIVKYGGAAYLVFLAWQIATSGPVAEDGETKRRPMSFFKAVAFQWVNPKGWVMALGAVTTYAAVTGFPFNMLVIAAVFCTFGLLSSLTWVMFGTSLRHLVTNPRTVRIFDIVMALALVASLYPILMETWPGSC